MNIDYLFSGKRIHLSIKASREERLSLFEVKLRSKKQLSRWANNPKGTSMHEICYKLRENFWKEFGKKVNNINIEYAISTGEEKEILIGKASKRDVFLLFKSMVLPATIVKEINSLILKLENA